MTKKEAKIPLWKKSLLSLDEAAIYTGIGVNKLRTLSDEKNCDFVLWNGSKRMFKRHKLDAFLDNAYSI